MKARLVGLLIIGMFSASCAAGERHPSPPSDAQGTWILASIVEDDGTSHSADPAVETTWEVDVAARTYVSRMRVLELHPGQPDLVLSFAFKVTTEGHWLVEDPGPVKRWIEFAVECTPTALTLTRVGQEGMESVAPPPGGVIEVYEDGTAHPFAPPPAPVLPPKVLRFSR